MNEKIITRDVNVCDECGSEYYANASKMNQLCPECAHLIYGYDNCNHHFEHNRCINCFWDGSGSKYLTDLNNKKNRQL